LSNSIVNATSAWESSEHKGKPVCFIDNLK
jgi:hypothetical protein